MDLPAALTLAFAGVGALGTVYTVVDGFTKRRAERRRETEAIQGNWSLHAQPAPESGRFVLSLTCNDATTTPIRVISVSVVEPRNSRLCVSRLIAGPGPPVVELDGAEWSATLHLDRDLSGTVVWGDGQRASIDWVVLWMTAEIPPPLLGRRGRFRLALTFEERTAARRRRTVPVKSQEINFAGRADHDAT